MRKQFKQNYKESNKKEEQRSFKYQEYPQLHEYYSMKMSTGQKPNKRMEMYGESSPEARNIQTSSESYKYYSEYTPYNKMNQYKNISQNNIFSKNEYYTNIKNSDYDNVEGLYSSYRKKMLFGNTDLRNEYSPIAEARVNIRKKLLEERNNEGYQTDINGNLVENFQYHESQNVRNKSDQKYDSITRIVGYSNIIPIHTRKMVYNYSNIDVNKNGNYSSNYNKKIEHNYIQRKEVTNIQQKKEFKKPAQLETVKKHEIIKKYEITKKPEIKKEDANKYKKYERKKEEFKKEVKKTEITKKTEVKKENKQKIEIKKEVKEPKIIKRKENVKAVFSVHSGRYPYKNNISNDIINSRKNYNQNSQEKNVKKVEIIQSSKSAKKEEKSKIANTEKKSLSVKKEVPKSEIKRSEIIKKEEKTTKIVSNVKPVVNKVNITETKKINISENISNYKRKKEEIKNVPKMNNIIQKNRNITVKTEYYGKIDENLFRKKNMDIGQMINIKEINRIYEMKRKNRNVTPKMKTKRINLGDNYKYYERKYMQSPDENYLTIHQRRNQRIIYGEQIIESNGVIKKMKVYKSKPLIKEERYNSQMINKSKLGNDNYMSFNKFYQNEHNWENQRRFCDNEDGEYYYYEQGRTYH